MEVLVKGILELIPNPSFISSEEIFEIRGMKINRVVLNKHRTSLTKVKTHRISMKELGVKNGAFTNLVRDFKYALSTNSAAVSFLNNHSEYIHPTGILVNNCALGLIGQVISTLKESNADMHSTYNTLGFNTNVDILKLYVPIQNIALSNTAAISLIEERFTTKNFMFTLEKNRAAAHLIPANIEEHMYMFASNPATIHIVLENLGLKRVEEFVTSNDKRVKKMLGYLASNPALVDLFSSKPLRMKYSKQLSNNPAAGDLLQIIYEEGGELDWEQVGKNPSAINLLKTVPLGSVWNVLGENKAAVELFESHPKKIRWEKLAWNPHAWHLLEELFFDSYLIMNTVIGKWSLGCRRYPDF